MIFSNPISRAALAFSNDIAGVRYLFTSDASPFLFYGAAAIKRFFADEYADRDVGVQGGFYEELNNLTPE
jgi:hypothetical protein